MQKATPHLHFLSFANFFVVVSWRRQPHVAEGQLSLWLPAVVRDKIQTFNKTQSSNHFSSVELSSVSVTTCWDCSDVVVLNNISLLCSTLTDVAKIQIEMDHSL